METTSLFRVEGLDSIQRESYKIGCRRPWTCSMGSGFIRRSKGLQCTAKTFGIGLGGTMMLVNCPASAFQNV